MIGIKQFSHFIAVLIISILSLFPLYNNYKYNDHSKNWLNHDYGKNLLSSTEESSVFMTEGGDNQVFSSLYFTYAEKLRQDIYPYDQKGNIFKRIYGDLRYVTADVLDARKPLVDKGLFTGEEPFYENIRSSAEPYFVPYALGKPATYLTWKLPDPQQLGDFYYKNYGQMYKVQPIRYALVDYLETVKNHSLRDLRTYLNKTLGRPINTDEWNMWVKQLVADGYISTNSVSATFIKSYPKPFDKDPKESYITRWDEIPNIQYFDYLSREIVNSYSYEQITVLGDEIENLQTLLRTETEPTIISSIQKQIDTKWEQLAYYREQLDKTAFDSIGILHNLGIFYLGAQDRFNLDKSYIDDAIRIWEKGVDSFKYSWSTYSILLWAYLQKVIQDPENGEQYLAKFDKYYQQMKDSTRHWKSMKDFTKSAPYQNTQSLLSTRENIQAFTGEKFIQQQQQARTEINTASGNVSTVITYLSKMVNKISIYQDPVEVEELLHDWGIAWNNYKNIPEFSTWHFQALSEFANFIDIADSKVINDTLRDGATILNTLPALQQKFNGVLYLANISRTVKNNTYQQQYNALALSIAKNNVSDEQYKQLERQLYNGIQ